MQKMRCSELLVAMHLGQFLTRALPAMSAGTAAHVGSKLTCEAIDVLEVDLDCDVAAEDMRHKQGFSAPGGEGWWGFCVHISSTGALLL